MMIAGPSKLISAIAMPIMAWRRTSVGSSSTWWAPTPCAYCWPPPGPCGSLSPASGRPTCRCSSGDRGTVTRWPQASLTWHGPVGKSCRRREFSPYLGFSPLWPKINRRLVHQSSLRLKTAKLMPRAYHEFIKNYSHIINNSYDFFRSLWVAFPLDREGLPSKPVFLKEGDRGFIIFLYPFHEKY